MRVLRWLSLGLVLLGMVEIGRATHVAMTNSGAIHNPVLQWALMSIEPRIARRFGRPPPSVVPLRNDVGTDEVHGIVVLGGALERMDAAIALAQKHKSARLIVSGAKPNELAVLGQALLETRRVLIDPRPADTWDNGVMSRERAKPGPRERWLLVTSALHMPRAMGAFRQAGWPEILAWPVEPVETRAHYRAPRVLHEMLGLVSYRLRGRTDAFLPAP